MQAAAVAVIIAVVLSLVGEIDAPARDRAQVRAFLRAHGLERTPEGYEVDHIIPLCAGGADSPENMQLLTVEQHAEKTSIDLRWCYYLRKAKELQEMQREWQEAHERMKGDQWNSSDHSSGLP